MDTGFCNSERESVIEAAIDTISEISINHQNSDWYRGGGIEQDEFRTTETSVTNGKGNENERLVAVDDDCGNLHSDTSSHYQDHKTGFEVTVRRDLQAPKTRRSYQTHILTDNSTPRGSYNVNISSGRAAMAGNYSRNYSVGVNHVDTPQPSHVTISQRQSLHGLEISDSKQLSREDTYDELPSAGKRNSLPAKNLTPKGLYSCKIIRRERNAGVKLRREIQMRREDEGTPKVVRLVGDRAGKHHDIDELQVHRESSSLVDQMRKWFNVQRSNDTKIVRGTTPKLNTERDRDHTAITSPDDQLKHPEKLVTVDLEKEIISRGKSHTSLSNDEEYHDSQSRKGTATKERATVFRHSIEKNSNIGHGTISDTITYRSMDRGTIRKRIRELNKLKRSKRQITPTQPTGNEHQKSTMYDPNIAEEKTYKKGPPSKKVPKGGRSIPFVLRNSVGVDDSEMTRAARNPRVTISVPNPCDDSTDPIEFPVMTQRCSLEELTCAHSSRKDAASGAESYPRFRMPYFRDPLSNVIHDTVSSTRDVSVGSAEIGIQTSDSTVQEAVRSTESTQDRSRDKLFRNLWSGLREHRHCIDGLNIENPTAGGPSAVPDSVCVIYADGYGNHKKLSSNAWYEIRKLLFSDINLKS